MSRERGTKLKPRDYQVEAARWALSRDGAVVVMPTGSGKTLIAILWSRELLERREVRRVLFLEPTRLLVEQVARYVSKLLSVPVRAIHGKYTKEDRRELWRRATVAVATPETALSDRDVINELGFDAVVVDECHHTTGKDAYAEFMARAKFKRRLGLSAYIPPSRVREIEQHIGPVRSWSWGDERIRKYVPPWIGEIYEAELNAAERKVLEVLEETRLGLEGRARGLVQTAIRWFARDGALALKESLGKETMLASLLAHVRPLLSNPEVRDLHKLDALRRVLRDHEGFSKAIVFVDRVIVAREIAEELSEYNPVVIHGKRKCSIDVREALARATDPSTKLIVSTSAGEEGMDLPEADLLVIWSNVASPLRFIQRHGRILRLTGSRKLKFVTYIVTPDTPDLDSLIDSLEAARKAGVDVPVSEEVIEALWRRTTRSRLLGILEGRPMPPEWLAEAAGMPLDLTEKALRKLSERGEVVYIHTHLGRTYALPEDISILKESYGECLEPDTNLEGRVKAYVGSRALKAISGKYHELVEKLGKLIKRYGGLSKLMISLEVPLPTGAYQLVNLHYNFLIDDIEKLDLVLRNALSIRSYLKYLAQHRIEEDEEA